MHGIESKNREEKEKREREKRKIILKDKKQRKNSLKIQISEPCQTRPISRHLVL